jgi:hypothetical protein
MDRLIGEIKEKILVLRSLLYDLLGPFREDVCRVLPFGLPCGPSAVGTAVGCAGIVEVKSSSKALVGEVVSASL